MFMGFINCGAPNPVIWEAMIFRMNIGLMGSYPDGIWEELMEPQNQTWELMEIFPVGVLSELMEIEDSRKKTLDWIGILYIENLMGFNGLLMWLYGI